MMKQEMQRMKTENAASKEEFTKVMKGDHNKMIDTIDDLRRMIDKQEMQLKITTTSPQYTTTTFSTTLTMIYSP
jgi:hypothetical protein